MQTPASLSSWVLVENANAWIPSRPTDSDSQELLPVTNDSLSRFLGDTPEPTVYWETTFH